jgi:cell division protein FtsI/penicillin-binding protein 2
LDSLANRRTIAGALALALLQICTPRCVSGQDLHAQSAAAALARDFADPNLSFLLLDEDGQVMAQRWEHPEQDIPVGSLTKPFMAVAYGRTHQSFPKFRCTGGNTCWLRRGHGTLKVREAIAFSCNSYFHQLVAHAGPEFRAAMATFALRSADGHADDLPLTTASPLALSRAYLELTRQAREPAVAPVLQGLALSARTGTAKPVGAGISGMNVLAKTGTAPCTHKKKAPGDGFVVVMWPAEKPRSLLLVRLHGRPGYMAAALAGRMIAKVEAGAAP